MDFSFKNKIISRLRKYVIIFVTWSILFIRKEEKQKQIGLTQSWGLGNTKSVPQLGKRVGSPMCNHCAKKIEIKHTHITKFKILIH